MSSQLAPVAEPPRYASLVYMPDERDAPGEEDTGARMPLAAHPDSVEASEERALAALAHHHHELAAEAQQQARGAEPGLAAAGDDVGAAEQPLDGYRQHSHDAAADALASAAAYDEQAREQAPHDDDAARTARASAEAHAAAPQPPSTSAVEGQQPSGPGGRPIAFLSKLWAMIHSTEEHIRAQIYWGDPEACVEAEEERDEAKGSPVVVRDTTAFAKVVLPKFFKHNNWSSFQRQLNLYGFRKLNDLQRALPEAAAQDASMFRHPLFRRDHPELLSGIRRQQRKNEPEVAAAPSHSVSRAGPSSERAAKRRRGSNEPTPVLGDAPWDWNALAGGDISGEAPPAEASAEASGSGSAPLSAALEARFEAQAARIEEQSRMLNQLARGVLHTRQQAAATAAKAHLALGAVCQAVEASALQVDIGGRLSAALARISDFGDACESMRQGLDVADLLGAGPNEIDPAAKRASGSSRPSTAGNPRRGRNRPATLEEILAAISAGDDGEGSSTSANQAQRAPGDAQANTGEASPEEQRDDSEAPAQHDAELDASMREADELLASAGGSAHAHNGGAVDGDAAEQQQRSDMRMLLEPPTYEAQQQHDHEQRPAPDAEHDAQLHEYGGA